RAVGHQVGEYPDQVRTGAALPEHRHPQRPIALEIEPYERPGGHEIVDVPGRLDVVTDGQDVQADLPRPGYLLARATFLAGNRSGPQGGVPGHQPAQPGRRGLDGAVGQRHHSVHGELVAAFLHVLPDRLLAPAERRRARVRSRARDGETNLAVPLEHSW